jgi:predicted DNA-binding transcriptional regulator AlpA
VPKLCPSVTKTQALAALVESATQDELPTLAADLARALGVVLAKTATAGPQMAHSPPEIASGLLNVEEAAERLGVATAWLYRHHKSLPFTRKLGHRTLRFDSRALQRWADTQSGAIGVARSAAHPRLDHRRGHED